MNSLLHGAALGLCLTGCCLMARHPNWAWRISAAVMAASMVDVIVGPHILTPIGWSALLIATTVLVAVADGSSLTVRTSIRAPGRLAESLQVSVGSIAMAATMPFMHVAVIGLCTSDQAGPSAFSPLPLLAIAPILYGSVSYHAMSHTTRSPARVAEATAMTLSLVLMTSTSLIHPS